MYILIDTQDGGRVQGFSKYETSTNNPRFNIIETSESKLKSVFEDAKDGGETLEGTDSSMKSAIEDPLKFLDFLIFADGGFEFDADYTRDTPS